MAVIKHTAQAEEDLIEIWLYIAQDNPAAADRLLEEIDDKCRLLADNLRLGSARPEIAPELRYWLCCKNFVVGRGWPWSGRDRRGRTGIPYSGGGTLRPK